MKYFVFPIALAFTVFFACSKCQNSNLSERTPIVVDSVEIVEIDAFLQDVDNTLQTGLSPLQTTFEFLGETRTMGYYDLSTGTQRWSGKVSPEGNESYATFFLKNEIPRVFRYRHWDKIGVNSALEIVMYLKDGKIFYAKERATEPGSNQTPGYLLDAPFNHSERSLEELTEIFNQFYVPMKKGWDNRKG